MVETDTPAEGDEPSGPEERRFPIVGIGASAGGVEALLKLVGALEIGSGLAYVVVLHLDPTHASALPELFERATTLEVVTVADGMPVCPERIHVIPPNTTLTIERGLLRLGPRTAPHLPVDVLLRSLAADRQERAVAVILSGSGSDGALGLSAVKAAGGITFAQDQTAAYLGMPRQAIATGHVDYVLPPDAIGRELARIGSHPYLAPAEVREEEDAAGHLARILRLVQRASGIDFSQYKSATIRRRLLRRLALNRLSSLASYVDFLREHPQELELLANDILIQVTRFFRDPEAFEALAERVYPELLRDRAEGESIRIWVPGCATGEEVYSIAISLLEHLGDRSGPSIKIFGTDLNESAIAIARRGEFLENIAADVSTDRVRRFFTRTEKGLRINAGVRDLCVFARQDVGRDPPFSHLDLISCRNVLIYFGRGLQRGVVPIFHYALKPGGFLLLGTSETIGQFPELFALVDPAHKLYVRQPGGPRALFELPADEARERRLPAEAGRLIGSGVSSGQELQREADRFVTDRYGPAGVIVDRALEVIQFRGDTGRFLRPAPGAASFGLLKMARPGLIGDLRQGIEEAFGSGRLVRREGVRVRTNDHVVEVDLLAVPLGRPAGEHLLVLFDQRSGSPRPGGGWLRRWLGGGGPPEPDPAPELAALEAELAETRRYLQALVEDGEAANEELRAANEEILSSNEELQSTNEELETAKEELQATNEELNTVNDQLGSRNADLGLVNDDLRNLLESVDLPIVTLGEDLRIRWFTPPAARLFGLIAGDLGRPIGDLRPALQAVDLPALAADAIERLGPIELDARDADGRWHRLSARPYRTTDNRVAGALIVLVDIDALRRSEGRARAAQELAERMIESVPDPVLLLNGEQVVQRVNEAFVVQYGVVAEEVVGQPLPQVRGGALAIARVGELIAALRDAPNGQRVEEVGCELAAVGRRHLRITVRALPPDDVRASPMLVLVLDLTERRRAEERIRRAARLAEIGTLAAGLAHEGGNALQRGAGALERLALRLDDDPAALARIPDAAALLSQARQALDFLGELFDDVRGYTHALQLDRQPRDLGRLLGQAWSMLGDRRAGRDATLDDPGAPFDLRCEVDETQLVQVLVNVLDNALTFCPDPLVVQARWAEVLLDGRAALRLSLADNGPGLPEADRHQLFEPFFSTRGGGSGLGLAISRRIVEFHEGTIHTGEPAAGVGAEIVICLPRTQVSR